MAKNFIDFKTLSTKQLRDLSDKWERDAQMFEEKMERYRINVHGNNAPEILEKSEKLWNTANQLWKRLRILERWRLNNSNKKFLKSV